MPSETVEEALERFYGRTSSTPDYIGFVNWIRAKEAALDSTPVLPIHAITDPLPLVKLKLELVNAATDAGIKLTRDAATPIPERFGRPKNGESALKALNRAKLLLHYFKELPSRSRESFSLLTAPRTQSSAVPSIPASSSQLQHRDAFFQAVAIGDARAASKMLGRLRDEEHDVGELAFLEATESFHSKHYRGAIEYAKKVPETAIDWPRAYMLIVESHAFLGDVGGMEEAIGAKPDFKFPDFFIPYIYQVAIKNCSAPEQITERAISIVNDNIKLAQPGLGVFHIWNSHTCETAVEFVEQIQQVSLRDLAAGESTNRRIAERTNLDYPLRTKQVQGALLIDSDLALKLLHTTPEEAYIEIVKQLLNWNHTGPVAYRQSCIQALVTQWRIGDRTVFVDNVLTNLDTLIACADDAIWQVIGWAYQEAMVLGREKDAGIFRQRLVSSPMR